MVPVASPPQLHAEVATPAKPVAIGAHAPQAPGLGGAVIALLLVVGFGGYLTMEWSNPATLGNQGVGTKVLAAGFAAIMPRSGGFATLDVGQLTTESRLLTDLLMFIGGGSGSTAGGIRVTTFALLMLSIWAEIRGNPDVEVFGRRIPHDTIRQAIGVLVMSATIVFAATAHAASARRAERGNADASTVDVTRRRPAPPARHRAPCAAHR